MRRGVCRCRTSHCRTVSPCRPVIDTPHVRRSAARSRQPMPFHRMTPAEQMQRRRQRRTLEARHAAVPIDHVDVQIGLHVHVRGGVRCGGETRTSRDSRRPGRAARCPRARRSPGSVNAVALPPSVGRASSTRTRTPCSASAVAALRPAKPPPMTTTSMLNANASAQCLTLESVGLGTGARRRAPSSVCSQMRSAITARCGRGTRMRDVNTS